MKIKIKKLHPDAVIPLYAKPGDAGMDLYATSAVCCDNKWHVGFGIAMEIPKGYVGLIFPRSSVCKKDLSLTNCVGVIDSGYRGEISAVFRFEPFYRDCGTNTNMRVYNVGERAAQIIIMPYPEVEFEEAEELSETERGTGGYGSTGK